jgi:hypothetical protein
VDEDSCDTSKDGSTSPDSSIAGDGYWVTRDDIKYLNAPFRDFANLDKASWTQMSQQAPQKNRS